MHMVSANLHISDSLHSMVYDSCVNLHNIPIYRYSLAIMDETIWVNAILQIMFECITMYVFPYGNM